MEAKQCAPPSGKHSTSQAISIHLSTAMNVTFTQLHWLPHPCIQHLIVHSGWIANAIIHQLIWQQTHSLSSFTNRLLVIQEDPFPAHYSTLLNDALTGSTADITLSPVTTFIRLVIANIATNSQCDIMQNMYHTLFNSWLLSHSWLETPATEILFAKVQVWWPKTTT